MEIWWIILIVVVVIAFLSAMLSISNYASDKFLAEHEEMSSKPAHAHRSVLEFISETNLEKLGGKLKIARTQKKVGDGYNSKTKTLILSDETLTRDSIAAFAIAGHELGHALQDAQGKTLRRKLALQRAGWIFGKMFLPSLIVFAVLLFFPQYLTISIIFGGISFFIFALASFLKILTIVIEKDASKRAIEMLDEFISEPDMKLVRRYLKSARLTYWSDLMRLFFGWSGLTRKTKMFK